ncbi:MAG: redox-regulated ATPase YchF [Candidatus Taylorbacteria bacterium RIFCSPLOWO2_12_FULL_43_20]|uniref:Ribosome-binding ATPase YchF n=1 Tax=Candidatus Taylorbacteria bacterium RIFCSPLOWO2_12_FULL_43_20 TaxID=1802332 RepID=A0A1G2P1L7_9BACT|nr:MAG: redox-regulated ATPase YchF [Candidatus Taylorbacteria bacterium RIFCSPHIGHO2_12_FULL_42_34]OHA30254.1 MAG: redox-regulated ATPase YchF [Candidatus Taylorbacteria bacterium RIFCSPLOWO2_01_FULL_43_83]OHA39452.1 MAG: redox-regulated ATPase YchF [Candidatus Taylorbacteria bacterium RIFCSPLOWO2_02_FULL_43_22b]OHA42247.1 MAG: redox-regulated ATPase YchF [Candidatus Taylorbacteria bacterium RIFCSPLOWO2_12_FULL_43_20]
MKIGIVGLPNVGKSTLFNALTKKSVPAENYPFCTIDPSVGVVAVPDERLDRLSRFSNSEKTVPAAVEFVDIAGLVKGASEGEGLGNQFLTNIRETDAIAEVVRIFEDDDVIHVDGGIDPMRDIEVINLELILADMQTVTKRLGSLDKEVKRGDKEALIEQSALKKTLEFLELGKLARYAPMDEKEAVAAKKLQLLTMKLIMYVLNRKSGGKNLDEHDASGQADDRYKKLMNFMLESDAKWVVVDAGIEHELKDLEGEDKEVFRKELSGNDSSTSLGTGDGIDHLIRKGYELLELITYFTTGKDETRAWTIKRGWTAPLAGTAIHTDFKDKFVRAEIIEWDKLLEVGSYAAAREKGLIRTEGKEYVVKDGDVMEFRI